MPKRRSPQEKKRLSYTKDRRNNYGENDKSSRTSIAHHKRRRHRTERHHAHQQLSTALGPVDELVEERVPPVGDEPGEVVAVGQLEGQHRRGLVGSQ